jgi:hypothetical protein
MASRRATYVNFLGVVDAFFDQLEERERKREFKAGQLVY